MREFGYARPADEGAVLTALAAPGTAAIAGGTELLNWMRLGITEPSQVVDLGGLPDLAGIAVEGPWLTIGALADLNQVGQHPLVAEHASALGQACLKAASAQVRNRATLGGNVLQRTRCAYFRAEEPLPWACNKRVPGSGCAARHGANDQLAVFGWTDECVATQPSDPLVALACLDAEVHLVHPGGRRWLPVRQLHLTQQEAQREGGDPAALETRLASGELIVGYRVPLRAGTGSAYVKVRERESYAYALVSAAASVRLDGDRIARVRIALGSVAQRPWRLEEAEAALVGAPLDAGAVREAVDAATADARPLPENAYKVPMVRAAAVRAVLDAGAR